MLSHASQLRGDERCKILGLRSEKGNARRMTVESDGMVAPYVQRNQTTLFSCKKTPTRTAIESLCPEMGFMKGEARVVKGTAHLKAPTYRRGDRMLGSMFKFHHVVEKKGVWPQSRDKARNTDIKRRSRLSGQLPKEFVIFLGINAAKERC